MALRAGDRSVLPGQRVVRVESMIELCCRPVYCRVARAAVPREAQLHVGRVRGLVEVAAVA